MGNLIDEAYKETYCNGLNGRDRCPLFDGNNCQSEDPIRISRLSELSSSRLNPPKTKTAQKREATWRNCIILTPLLSEEQLSAASLV